MILYGAGGHGKVVSTACFNRMKFFFDKAPSDKKVNGFDVKTYDSKILADCPVVVTIGKNLVRKKVANLIQHNFGKIIDKSAVLSSVP